MRGIRILCVLAGLVIVSEARAVQLLTNGGFETGTFAGWSLFDQPGGNGSFVIDNNADGFTPLSGNPTVGPASGNFYAVTDQGGPGAHALSQNFTVPGIASSVMLSFDMFVNDADGGPIVHPAGLDFNAIPNQHARVDILDAAAAPLTTTAGPGGVLQNYYLSVDPGPDPHLYTHYSFDITALVGAGGTFNLRFAEVDNQLFLNQGVDNVRIDFVSAAAAVPMPLAFSSGLVLIGGMGLGRKRLAALNH